MSKKEFNAMKTALDLEIEAKEELMEKFLDNKRKQMEGRFHRDEEVT